MVVLSNLTQKAMNCNNVSIVTVKGNDYRIHLLYMSKEEAANLLRNADLTFARIEIEKRKFHRYESFIFLENVDC